MQHKIKSAKCDLSDAIIRDVQHTDIKKLCYQIVNEKTYDSIMNLLILFPRGIDDIIMTYAEFIVVYFNQSRNEIINVNAIIKKTNKIKYGFKPVRQIEFNVGNYHMVVFNKILLEFGDTCLYYDEPAENMYYKPNTNAIIYGNDNDCKFSICTQCIQSQQITFLRKQVNTDIMIPRRSYTINNTLIIVDYCSNPGIPESIMKIISNHAVDNTYYYGVSSSLNQYCEREYNTVIKIKKDDMMDDELYEYLYGQIYVTFTALNKNYK